MTSHSKGPRALAVPLAAAVLLATASCAARPPGDAGLPAGSVAATSASMRVTADLYSGRPNPTWILSADEATRLAAVVRSASPERSTAAADGRLGFREFTVESLPADLPYRRLSVAVGRVEGTTAEGREVVLAGCEGLFPLLRTSAQANLGEAASGIPQG